MCGHNVKSKRSQRGYGRKQLHRRHKEAGHTNIGQAEVSGGSLGLRPTHRTKKALMASSAR